MELTLQEKIEAWAQLDSALKKIKSDELKIRKEICTEVFKGRQGAFTEKVDIGHSVITASSKTTLSIDEELLENIWDELDDDERACIKYKPSILKTNLKVISDESEIYDCITEKPATPSLTIKQKK